MRDYRQLTQEEIDVLERNSCWAENWNHVKVAEDFSPYGFHRVIFYGDIRLGVFEKQVEVTKASRSTQASMMLHCAMLLLATTV